MADPIITNGARALIFRPANFVVPVVPAWAKEQLIHDNSAGLPRTNTKNHLPSRHLQVVLDLEREDRGIYAGYDSLYQFFEADDYRGVNGQDKSFMLTDADGVAYQVKFAEPLALRERIKDSHFEGTITLHNEQSLPTEQAAPPALWFAAYDMDNNGGNNSDWTNVDVVDTWTDKGPNGWNAVQGTNPLRPDYRYDYGSGSAFQINERPCLNFEDASSQYLIIDSVTDHAWLDAQADQKWTFYAMIDTGTGVSEDTILGYGHLTTASHLSLGHVDWGGGSPGFGYEIKDAAAATKTEGTDNSGAGAALLTLVCNGTTVEIYEDGVLEETGADADVSTMDVDGATIGSLVESGVNGNYFDGRIAELLFFSDTQHTTAEIRRQQRRIADMAGHTLTG